VDDEHPAETEEPEEAPATKEAPVTKVSPVVTQAEAEAAAVADDDERPVLDHSGFRFGPLFALGALLLIVGLLRRRPLALAAGVAAIWLDQRSELGQSLKARFDERLKAQIKAHARG
jgi:hypothetical protein